MSLDGVSRSLARREERAGRAADGLVLTEPLVDVLARTLTTPMRRRRAIGIVSGTLLAATALRPRRAHAATCTADEHKCTEGGREICAPNANVCCNIPNCAAAYCREPWAACGSGYACNDTPRMCTEFHYGGPNALQFCSTQVDIRDSCRDTKGIAGWCCHTSMVCSKNFRECDCPSKVTCGVQCCRSNQYCESGLFGEDHCEDYCFGKKQRCNGICCTDQEFCGGLFGCICKLGYSAVGTECVKPRQDPGDPPSDNAASRMLKMMRQTNAASGGGSRRSTGGRAAAAPPPAVATALAALAAVDGQGSAAILGIRGGKRDPRFRQTVKVARVKPPAIVAGLGLDAASAAALNKYLAAQANANALIAATATAVWRMRGAQARRDAVAAKRQLRAAAGFASQASRALNKLPALRSAAAGALTAGQVAEVTVGADVVAQGIAAVKSGNFPATLKAGLANLGVGAADLKRMRSGAASVPALGGGCLIEPLQEVSQDTQLASALTQWSAKARAHPIAK
jgi:hypothetical protein